MPRAPKHCGRPGCPNKVVARTYCDDCKPQPWAGSTRGPATAHRRWRNLRDQILKRDNWTCHVCRGEGADTVDHIISKANGGTDHPSNLAAIHDRNPPHCHRAKTADDRTQRR